jgi:hypothetical protein
LREAKRTTPTQLSAFTSSFLSSRLAPSLPTPGPDAIRRQDPHEQPQRSKKSPAPLFHAVRLRVKKELYTAYAGFLAAFREAAEKWRSGERTVVFPIGCYPPALPFVEG